MSGQLANLNGPTAREALHDDAIVLLPIGAIEQHGPHLPLSTDHVIADEVARAAVAALGDELDVWMVPTLPYSKSDEHAWSPGTMWLSTATMLAVIDDLARCVAASGARRIAFLNGHGGNSTLLNVACREARRTHGLLTFLVHAFLPPAYSAAGGADTTGEHGMGIHGGHEETSVMRHLRPDDVDMAQAVRNVPEWMLDNDHVRFGGSTQFGWLSDDFGAVGHIGDPTAASAADGERLFTAAVDGVVAQLREIATFDFPDQAGD